MTEHHNKILILGIGNDILMDDGIGPLIARRLEKDLLHPDLSFETLNLGGLEILEYIRDYSHVYIIDAIKTSEGQVGDVFFISPADFKETLHLSSLHDVGFLTALELAKELSMGVPGEIRIAAIEIREDTVFGTSLSQELNNKVEEVYRMIREEILKWLSGKL